MEPEKTQSSPGTRIGSAEILRCVAGTLVLWYHLSLNINNNFLRWTGSWGWCGVQIFLVVSGFIIPYSMQKSGYKFPRDIGSFLVRRLVRLDPPYFVASAAAALIACIAYRIPGFRGPPPDITWANMLAHIGYLNNILGMDFYIRACWTLGIELQFYILMAISFPLWVSRRSITFLCAASLTCLATWCLVHYGPKPGDPWFFFWAPYFILGIAGFRYHEGLGNGLEFIAVAGLSFAVAWLTGTAGGATAGIFAACFVTFVNVLPPKFLQRYAAMTYSLYLVHMPVGERAVRLLGRLGSNNIVVDLAALSGGVALSFAAAFLLWKYVEVPAMRWSKMVAPGRSKPAEAPA
jgi:peptidoglycan/LPS O-acetylase OafA/YrhL